MVTLFYNLFMVEEVSPSYLGRWIWGRGEDVFSINDQSTSRCVLQFEFTKLRSSTKNMAQNKQKFNICHNLLMLHIFGHLMAKVSKNNEKIDFFHYFWIFFFSCVQKSQNIVKIENLWKILSLCRFCAHFDGFVAKKGFYLD